MCVHARRAQRERNELLGLQSMTVTRPPCLHFAMKSRNLSCTDLRMPWSSIKLYLTRRKITRHNLQIDVGMANYVLQLSTYCFGIRWRSSGFSDSEQARRWESFHRSHDGLPRFSKHVVARSIENGLGEIELRVKVNQ